MLLSFFLSFGAGMMVGFVIGAAMAIAGQDVQTITTACRVVGYAIGVALSFVCYRWSVQKFILPQLDLRADGVSG